VSGVSFGGRLKREWRGERTDCEESVEAEEEHGCHDAVQRAQTRRALLVDDGGGARAREDNHRGHLSEGAEEHEFAPPDALDQRDRDEACQEVLRAVCRGEETGHVGAETERVLEDVGCVVGLMDLSAFKGALLVLGGESVGATHYQVDAADLLEKLRCDTKERTAQVLRGPVGEQLAHFEAAPCALCRERFFDVGELEVHFVRVDICAG
jgi:hypothetical protein